MSRSFTLDQTGLMPESEYLRKIRASRMREDPNQVEDYIRTQLVDFRPDAPFFESDQPRNPSDRGSGNASAERLSLRHSGARVDESPHLPDGTFLDHEFTERDPRGTQNLPDFGSARAQKEARAQFIKFYDDSDYSVMESGVAPAQMVANIRGAQAQFKDRFQNFEESFDSWHNGGSMKRGDTAVVSLTTTDGTIMNLAEASHKNRADPVDKLSNRQPSLLRYTDPDHRVKISKYGMVRNMQDIDSTKWHENRNNAHLDHQKPVEISGTRANRMLANLIIDLQGMRATKQEVAKGAAYEESSGAIVRAARTKIHPDDLYKAIQIGMSSATQSATANQTFAGIGNAVRSSIGDKNVRTAVVDKVHLNHEVTNSMTQATRNPGVQKAKDARKHILTSASDTGLYVTRANATASVQRTKDRLARSTEDVRYVEDSKTTKSYGGIVPMSVRRTHEQSDFETYGSKSRTRDNLHRNQSSRRGADLEDTELGTGFQSEFALPGRKRTSDPKKYDGRATHADFGDGDRRESDENVDIKDALMNIMLSE